MERHTDMLKPPVLVLIKIGSALVHFDEATGPGGHEFDLHTARQLLADPDVKQWLEQMTNAAMLPVKRS